MVSKRERLQHGVAFSALIRRVTSVIRIGVQSSLPAFQHLPQCNQFSLPIGTSGNSEGLCNKTRIHLSVMTVPNRFHFRNTGNVGRHISSSHTSNLTFNNKRCKFTRNDLLKLKQANSQLPKSKSFPFCKNSLFSKVHLKYMKNIFKNYCMRI